MREHSVKSKNLDELLFDDLYMDDDELYPNITQALGRLKTRIKNRKHSTTHSAEPKEESFKLSMQGMHANHLRHTGI